MSKVLVIIPTISRPALCARAVESLVRQNFAAWDLGIVKNGGDANIDQYITALERFLPHPRIRLLVTFQGGLGNALNEGVRYFGRDHEYFANLEDDDEWHPEFLRTMYREARGSAADVVHCKQHQEPMARQSEGSPMDMRTIRHRNWINFPMCLFRMGLFKRTGGFCNEAGPATDWDWHLRCLKAGARYHFVPETLVTHHWQGDNYCLKVQNNQFIQRRMEEGVYG